MQPHVRRDYADGPFGQVHYRAIHGQGANTPLVCLHMNPNSGVVFESLISDIGRDRLAIAPDTPGFGGSDAPFAQPSITDFGDAIIHLIDSLGLSQIDILGYHTGAQIAANIAVRKPQKVRRVVMVGCPVFSDKERRHYRAAAQRQPGIHPRSGIPMGPASEDGEWLVNKWRGMMRLYGPEVPVAVVLRNFAESLRTGRHGHWGFNAAFADDFAATLQSLDQPCLVINPSDEIYEKTLAGVDLMRNAQLLDAPSWRHGFMDTHTAAVAQVLRTFLDNCSQAT